MVQRALSPNINLVKLVREAQQLTSEKGKQDWQFNNSWFDKERKLWFGLYNHPVLPDPLKFQLLNPNIPLLLKKKCP